MFGVILTALERAGLLAEQRRLQSALDEMAAEVERRGQEVDRLNAELSGLTAQRMPTLQFDQGRQTGAELMRAEVLKLIERLRSDPEPASTDETLNHLAHLVLMALPMLAQAGSRRSE